ncbi:MAG TPA: PAS domain S-box protein [Thermomicrobiales bacterium]|nr:PAS domain S-box protein [Thermomicrobiales bacterium]
MPSEANADPTRTDAARESHRRLSLGSVESLLATTSFGLGVLDQDLRFVQLNTTLAALSGAPVAAHTGRTLQELLPTLAPLLTPLCRQVLETGAPLLDQNICGRLPAQPAREQCWLVSGYPAETSADRAVGIALLVVDVTARQEATQAVASLETQVAERRQVEEALSQSLRQAEAAEAQFRGLLEAAPDGIVIVDHTGTIQLVNRMTELLFGYNRNELLGQPVELLIPEQLRDQHVTHRTGYMARPATRPMGVGLELLGRCKDGREFPVEISLSPLHMGTDLLVTAVIRDISRRRQAERELRDTAARLARQTTELARSNAELEQFAYVASHDLQEPLRMVASYTQLLARRYRGRLDDDADEFIGYAVDGATRMQQLIQDLLTYSRVGTRGLHVEPVNCTAVAERVVADLHAAITESAATVTIGPLPTLPGDRMQLGQLFQNLIANAIKYHGEAPPEVALAATREGQFWHFTVQDNGIGIAPEYAERIFVIFQRLHTQTEYSGTGIGLAICRKIVERHGGRIWVEPTPGPGATFHFTLPAEVAETE